MVVLDLEENVGKTNIGLTDKIPEGVRLHRGASLSPHLFAMIMDVLACGINYLSSYVPC